MGDSANDVTEQSPVMTTPVTGPLSPADEQVATHHMFAQEPIDPAWSRSEEHRVYKHISAVIPGRSRIIRSECRATMCRVETSHATLEDYQTYLRSVFMDPQHSLQSGPTMSTLLSDSNSDVIASVSYIARPDHALPF
jgi:hypothetical protein